MAGLGSQLPFQSLVIPTGPCWPLGPQLLLVPSCSHSLPSSLILKVSSFIHASGILPSLCSFPGTPCPPSSSSSSSSSSPECESPPQSLLPWFLHSTYFVTSSCSYIFLMVSLPPDVSARRQGCALSTALSGAQHSAWPPVRAPSALARYLNVLCGLLLLLFSPGGRQRDYQQLLLRPLSP